MKERFQGREGRAALLDALRRQFLVDGNSEIADQIASDMQIAEFAPGARLFTQRERGTDVMFILAGEVSVSVGVIEVARCATGTHVGEIALLEPFKGRSATVHAVDTVVVAQVSERRFSEVAAHHPELWRRLALGLGRRLVDLENRIYGSAT